MARTVAIIDYGSGNLRSAEKALVRAAGEAASGHVVTVTADPDMAARADRIVLPGVGAFADCMQGLCAVAGMPEALGDSVHRRNVPFLGICVGMQLLASVGREFGDHDGLGWIDAVVERIEPSDSALKVPHMGWNDLHLVRAHPLFVDVAEGASVYFVHSYAMHLNDKEDLIASTDYGGPVTAAVARGNIAGMQFHPEKSQMVGLQILKNFLMWQP